MSCGKSCNCESYGVHLRSINFSAKAMPTRTQSRQAISVDRTETGWQKDMPAYLRLRKDGMQPPHIDGSAKLEATATDRLEVESGKIYGNKLPMVKEVKAILSGVAK